DRFRDRLTDLLELPGAGRVLGGVLWALRSPYRWTRDYVYGLVARPDVLNLPEQTVLTGALGGWLDALQAESLRRAGAQPQSLWRHVAVQFDAELAPQARDRFAADLRAFELKESDDLEQAGKALVDGLEQNAALLYTLRGGKFALDLTIIAGVGYYTWPPGWPLVLVPLGVSASHQFAELATRGVAEGARRRVRSHRERLVASSLSDPLAAWLADWPSTGGTSFEKLQQVLRRVPQAVRAMEQRVRAKVGETARPEEAPTKPPTP
ncbi:MAG: hypothetical protein ACKODX_22695, partial [Gemmata sp.]